MIRHGLALLATLVLARPLAAQGPGFQLAHLFTDPSGNAYRLDWSSGLLGPLGVAPLATVIDSRGAIGNIWAVGLDLSLFRSGRPGLYAIGGLEGGVATEGQKTFRGAWSAGLGYEVFPIRGVSLAAEGRYRQIGPGNYGGLQFGVRLGLDRASRHSGGAASSGSSTTAAPVAAISPDPTTPEVAAIRADLGSEGVSEGRASVIGNVVQTALDVMGMPYRWGDEGEDGFDCSGLIRYAFGKQGITLPRRSSDQAREGDPISRSLDSLQAGDILTFSTRGKGISHVGLYVGNGKFIHSARQGVQLSVLSPDDISGRWWYRRWVGARRIVR